MFSSKPSAKQQEPVLFTLLPIMASVLSGFVVIGSALPVLPLHVHQDLGFGSFVVGLVTGAQFAASVLSRIWAGSHADLRGGRNAVIVGLITASLSGLLYLLSLGVPHSPNVSVAILLVGRAILGGAESFIITGGIAWGLALAVPSHAGKVIAWIGMAMFAGLALGGPLGMTLFSSYGFKALALLTIVLPIMVLLFVTRAQNVPRGSAGSKSTLREVVGAVWLPGVALAFSSIGYAAILAFSSLFYAQRGWEPLWLAFTAFGAALVVARIFFGHLPDKFGGAKVALIFVMLQSAGTGLMWLAPDALTASLGAAMAGFGYSLVYPGLGAEAVARVSLNNRGLAMGVFTVFLDVAMAIGTPVLGLVADGNGLNAVFLTGAGITVCAAFAAWHLWRGSPNKVAR